jgi:hypothetical protein
VLDVEGEELASTVRHTEDGSPESFVELVLRAGQAKTVRILGT